MATGDLLKSIGVIKFIGHFRSKNPARATRRNRPGVYVIGVRPHEVTVRSILRNFLPTLKKADLV